ncbi:MAG: FtsW/RodA/SpoVE family cell cycle protein [Clostridia bacterium]|nr:FtsW/RodA/SpoVE family cell cycle protein [Clostridia bacterium]MBQ5956705.1 FtsW/RodA/SpoVE family cell cycle protein [Clostridia bacterium]MBQ6003964.1 FtsW/RodA/SpoVE family cell cycle protein [Clostridia bacterium]MBR3563653.1 FtsW/RodA/SpoVE family cell cycle protein [Clostridia bacterium]
MNSKIQSRSTAAVVVLQTLFTLSAFALLSIRNGVFDPWALIMGACLSAFNVVQYYLLKKMFRSMDHFVILVSQFLWSVGIVEIYRISQRYAVRQAIFLVFGTAVMMIVISVIKSSRDFGKLNWLFMGGAVILLASTLVLSRAIGGARNWINIGPFSFQPSEFAKILFIMSSAYFLSTRDKLTSFIPYIIFTAVCVILLVVAKELGTGLLICATFLILFYSATGRKLLTILGIGVFGAGAYGSYRLFSHVRTRVEIWRDPWASYNAEGYQIVQGLLALASGGLFGTGLGKGMPGAIPASHTDYIFTVIGEEFGLIFAAILIVFYLVFIVRGMIIAMNTDSIYDALLVFGCTAMLSVQSFIIIGGVIKLIPLTGITLPFVSYGGSSLLSSMIQLGIIEGISIKNGSRDDRELEMMGQIMI